jgi:hypothetical protein
MHAYQQVATKQGPDRTTPTPFGCLTQTSATDAANPNPRNIRRFTKERKKHNTHSSSSGTSSQPKKEYHHSIDMANFFYSILWILLLFFFVWPISGFLTGIWIFLQVKHFFLTLLLWLLGFVIREPFR